MGCEYRTNCFLAANGFSACLRISEMCKPLPWRSQGTKLFLPRSVSFDGFRATNVSRESPRHRNVPTVYRHKLYHLGFRFQSLARLAGIERFYPARYYFAAGGGYGGGISA